MRRLFGWTGWLVAALLALGIGVSWADARWLTAVPDLGGLSPAMAEARLAEAHLRTGGIRTTAGSRAGLESESVRSQNPTAGRIVRRGSAVDLVTRRDTEAFVPNVVGLYYKDATAALSEAGFWCAPSSTSSTASTGQEPNQTVSDALANLDSLDAIVMTQTPPPGAVRSEGTTVTVTAKSAHAAGGTMSRDDFLSIHGALYLRYGMRGAKPCVLCHSIQSCSGPSCHASRSFAEIQGPGSPSR